MEEKVCKGCGCIIEGDGTKIGHDYFCDDCKDDWTECEYCNEAVLKDDSFGAPDGRVFCEDCFNERCLVCGRCGETVWADCAYEVHAGRRYTEYWCEDCCDEAAFQCEDCGEYYSCDIYSSYEINGRLVCEDCASDNYYWCDRCERYVDGDDWDDGEGCCRDCVNSGSAIIAGYHHHPRITPFGSANDKKTERNWYIGAELEIDRGSYSGTAERELLNELEELAEGHIYYEHDGSLENGFEIITQPHSRAAFNELPWEKMLDACKRHGYTSHKARTCGLHLHYSLAALGKTELERTNAAVKLAIFFDHYWNDILKVARRTAEQADRWAASYEGASRKELEDNFRYKGAGRYHAVNFCTSTGSTIEIRIMRGTLNLASFKACVDFCTTVVRNSRYVPWNDINNTDRWLKGLKKETWKYLGGRKAFGGTGEDDICA